MADVADVATIEEIAARVAEDIITQVTRRLDERLAEQDRRIDDLATTVRLAAAGVTKMIQQLAADSARPPGGQPPPALDAACAAAPGAGPQRVELDVHGQRVTEYVQPGDDPTAVWADVCAAVTSHQRAGADAWQN